MWIGGWASLGVKGLATCVTFGDCNGFFCSFIWRVLICDGLVNNNDINHNWIDWKLSACETLYCHCPDQFSSLPFSMFQLLLLYQIIFVESILCPFCTPYILDLICHFVNSLIFYRRQYCVHFAPPTFWTWFVASSIHWNSIDVKIVSILHPLHFGLDLLL